MTLQEILKLAVKSGDFNSNNDWGFGGARGTRYTFENGTVVEIAKAGTRHRGEFAYTKVIAKYKGDDPNRATITVLDKSGHKLSEKQLDLITKTIQS